MNGKLFKLLMTVICAGFMLVANATPEEYSVRLNASDIDEDISFEVIDGRYGELGLGTFYDKSTRFIVKLGVQERSDYGYFADDASITLELKVEELNHLGESISESTSSIMVSYSPGGAIETSLSVLKFEDGHRYRVTVEDITLTGVASLPEYVYLEGELRVDRYYELNREPILTSALGAHFIAYGTDNIKYRTSGNVNTHATSSYDDLGGTYSPMEVELYWDYIDGAHEYELEWTWVDTYDQTLSALDFDARDFERNNTRVLTTAQTYRIPLIYAKGVLIYRVRAVGRWVDESLTNVHKPVFGPWSSDGISLEHAADWPHYIVISEDHEALKNWQYQAVYAEEGKKKEIVSYFDGSLRNRQTVTRVNSNDEAIVGENVYDNQGRSAVQILPTPVENAALRYYTSLNLNSSGDVYTHYDFDWDTDGSSCDAPVETMSAASGASKYYSSNNSAEGNWQDYVPDADSIPFVQVEYTPDNTGRIRRQSGVGSVYQIDGNHATEYYYLQPFQEELNRLFGYQVGYKTRYKKNLVVDANGQVSISYIDPQGRVIATALAGDNDAGSGDFKTNLSSLESHDDGTAHNSMTIDLLNKYTSTDTDTDLDDNERFITGNYGTSVDALYFNTQYPSVDEQSHEFSYSVTTGTFSDDCMSTGVAYPFAYDLQINLMDDCGQVLFPSSIDSLISGTSSSGYTSALGTTITLDDPELTANLSTGAFTLTKLISVNQDTLEAHLQHYLANLEPECLPDFFTDNTDCGDTLTAEYELSDYDINTCFIKRGTMLADLSPGGQYGATDGVDLTSVFTEENALEQGADETSSTTNWLNPTTPYLNTDGTTAKITVEFVGGEWVPAVTVTPATEVDGSRTVKPEELENLADFLDYWEASWAESLLEYHPEYPYLAYYEDLCDEAPTTGSTYKIDGDYISSETYNNALLFINTYDLARSTDNVFGEDLLTSVFTGTFNLKDKDPYFDLDYSSHSALAGALDESAFKSDLMDEILSDYKDYDDSPDMDLWEFCVKAVVCGTDFTETCTTATTETFVESLTTEEQDQIWNMYKQTYLAEKRKVDQILVDSWAIRGEFYNGYISNDEPTLPNLMGFVYYPDYLLPDAGFVRIMTLYSDAIDAVAGEEFPWFTPPNTDLFADKIQRFEPIHAEYDAGLLESDMIDALAGETDAVVFAETGRCALSYDLEYFLNGLASEGLLTGGSSVNADDFPALTKDLYEAMGGGTGTYTPTISSTTVGSTIEIKVIDAFDGVAMAEIVLNDPPIGTWSDVIALEMLYYEPGSEVGGNYPFEILAKMDVAGTYYEKVLTGTTEVVIGDCYDTDADFEDVICDREQLLAADLLKAFMDLYNPGTNALQNYTAVSNTLSTTAFGGWFEGSELVVHIGDYPGSPLSEVVSTDYAFTIENFELTTSLISVNFGSFPADIESITGSELDLDGLDFIIHYIDDSGDPATFSGDIRINCSTNCINTDLTCMCDQEMALSTAFESFYNEMLESSAFSGTTGHEDYVFFETLGEVLYDDYEALGVTDIELSKSSTAITIEYTHSDASTCEVEIVHDGGSGDMSNLEAIFHIRVDEGTVSESFTATGFGYLSTGDIIPIEIRPVSGDETSCFSTVDCGCSSPTALPPLSCTDLYTTYHLEINSLNATWDDDPDYEDDPFPTYTEEEFCATNLAYSVNAYLNYLDLFSITDTQDDYYLSIAEFSATDLNSYYGEPDGSGDYASVDAFLDDTATYSGMDWNTYVNTIYMVENAICPPNPLPNYPELDLEDYPCEMYTANVDTVNEKNQREIYLQKLAENFRERYLEEAITSLVENFEVTYDDMEYHYTLYYYDKAGNLVQTVPPKGVDRFEGDINQDMVKLARLEDNDTTNAEVTGQVLPEHELNTQYHYNSLNQLVWQETPDGGESYFAYDPLGRLVVSQNAKQRLAGGANREQFSYTRYDELGRIIEVGEMTLNTTTNDYGFDNNGHFVVVGGSVVDVSATTFPHGMSDLVSVEEVTRTKYDQLEGLSASDFEDYAEYNTRNRITGVFYYEDYNDGTDDFESYDNATFYDYDVHGNVKELIQRIADEHLEDLAQDKKKVSYEYDLVSGNVKHVTYQKDSVDQFIHEYEYDADNRITHVRTSKDDIIWQQDAKYFYYDHGPLARTEIGDLKVVANDFAYTIQGWLKGVNSEDLDADHDQGKDSKTGINQMSGKDVSGYSLHYYANDYTARHGNDFLDLSEGVTAHNHDRDLFNGNIKEMFTGSSGTDEAYIGTSHTWYNYDQLNRIIDMNQEYMNGGTPVERYKAHYSFDANGNLDTLQRWAWDGTSMVAMDDFLYHYTTGTNQLTHVDDALGAGAPVLSDDLADQDAGNYAYTEIGELLSDDQEEIAEIKWHVTGKVHKIIRETTSDKSNLEFVYDALGNRIIKIEREANTDYLIKKTYYLRDAQGNVMSIYTLEPDAVTAINPSSYDISLTERSIYGSSRIGMENIGEVIASTNPANVNISSDLVVEHGNKRYELSNHLYNVLEVITDRKLAFDDGTGEVGYYIADIVSQNDYYPYGMLMPNTSVAPDEKDYRYTFNGKEFIPEVSGNGNVYDYGFRIYNPRLGKFLSEDPLTASYPWYTPYQFAGNTPIMAIDLDGLEEFIMIEQSDGTYKALWDIKARERGEAGTIQYIDAAGNIVQQVNKNGDLVNFRRVNSYEAENPFIDQRRRVENIEGRNTSSKYHHYPIGSTRSDNLPHTLLKLEDGTPAGEPYIDANTLFAPPPPPVTTTNPNTGGSSSSSPGTTSSSSGASTSSGTSTSSSTGLPVPAPLTLNAQWKSWEASLTNQDALESQTQPLIMYLLATPGSTITITTNAGSTEHGYGPNDWDVEGGGTLGFGDISLGELADARNKALWIALVSKGVSPDQIILERGSTDVGASSRAVINPPEN